MSRRRRVSLISDRPQITPVQEVNLYQMRVDHLRKAVHSNQVSFPAQIPTFPKGDRPDLQRKLVQLYFVLRWNGPKIGLRYGLTRERLEQILNSWKRRAVTLGYIQAIPADMPVFNVGRAPIHISLTPVVADSADPFRQISAARDLPHSIETPTCSPISRRGFRPRTKFSTSEISAALEQLADGRSVAEVANEMNVNQRTVRCWIMLHESRRLRDENAQLKERLVALGAVEKTLIDLITTRDRSQSLLFMPFSRVTSHTKADHRDSL